MVRLLHLIDKIERAWITVLFSTMLLLALSQIIARNLFDSGIIWADDAIKVLVLWVALFGALYATKLAKHINIDVASRFIPSAFGKWLKKGLYLASASICGLAAYHSWQFILLEMEDPFIAFLNVPTWVCELVIPFALIGMALRFWIMLFFAPSTQEGNV